jgi:hypothetical protein
MGSAPSSTMSDILLQDLQQHRIKYLLEGEQIVYHNRYADDIFVILNKKNNPPNHIPTF